MQSERKPMAKEKTKKTTKKVEQENADKELKEMVGALNELPTEVLEQLLKNLDAIEEYNKAHPEKRAKKKK